MSKYVNSNIITPITINEFESIFKIFFALSDIYLINMVPSAGIEPTFYP